MPEGDADLVDDGLPEDVREWEDDEHEPEDESED